MSVSYSTRKQCLVEGCTSPSKSRGMCGKHNERWKKYGSTSDSVVHHRWGFIAPKSQCSVADCENEVLAKSFCSKHYKRFQKYGTTDDSALHHQWGNGFLDKFGYRVVPENGKPRPEHHVIMEQVIGRRLYKWERVHHKNGIRDDNRPDNLELWAKGHPAGQRIDDLIDFIVEFYADRIPSVGKATASSGANPVTHDPAV